MCRVHRVNLNAHACKQSRSVSFCAWMLVFMLFCFVLAEALAFLLLCPKCSFQLSKNETPRFFHIMQKKQQSSHSEISIWKLIYWIRALRTSPTATIITDFRTASSCNTTKFKHQRYTDIVFSQTMCDYSYSTGPSRIPKIMLYC